jgi:hypothetical protein
MILGRWSSDAFLVYIRSQVLEWTTSMSKSMIKNLDYTHVAHSATSAQDNAESLLGGLQARFSYMGGDSSKVIHPTQSLMESVSLTSRCDAKPSRHKMSTATDNIIIIITSFIVIPITIVVIIINNRLFFMHPTSWAVRPLLFETTPTRTSPHDGLEELMKHYYRADNRRDPESKNRVEQPKSTTSFDISINDNPPIPRRLENRSAEPSKVGRSLCALLLFWSSRYSRASSPSGPCHSLTRMVTHDVTSKIPVNQPCNII